MAFSILAAFVLTTGTFVLGTGLEYVLATGVELSGMADDGITDGEGANEGANDGAIDDCSGNGANGTLGEYGGFALLMIDAWATVGCSLLASGTATVDVMGSAAAKAILFINSFKYIAKIRLTN